MLENEKVVQSEGADQYKGLLDYSFDVRFREIRLPWMPWVGARFRDQSSRTLVLGESVYDYSKGNDAKRAQIEHADSLRKRHLDHAIEAKFKSRYVRNFERAYHGKKKPTAQERKELWTAVTYHNLVPRMLESRKARPSDADYGEGWKQFIELAKCLGVQQVVVYGQERRKIAALRDLVPTGIQKLELPESGDVKPVGLALELSPGSVTRMLFIRHPSAYFRWKEWSTVVRRFCNVAQ